MQNIDDNTQVYGKYYNDSTYAMNLSQLPNLHINAHAYNSSGTSATPNSVFVKGNLNFKFYRLRKTADSGTSATNWDLYPVQRKSDGVIGIYNIIGDYFFPCKDASTDANVTTRTEPIADEY